MEDIAQSDAQTFHYPLMQGDTAGFALPMKLLKLISQNLIL